MLVIHSLLGINSIFGNTDKSGQHTAKVLTRMVRHISEHNQTHNPAVHV